MRSHDLDVRRRRLGISLAALCRVASVDYWTAYRRLAAGKVDSDEVIRLAEALDGMERAIAAAVLRESGLAVAAS